MRPNTRLVGNIVVVTWSISMRVRPFCPTVKTPNSVIIISTHPCPEQQRENEHFKISEVHTSTTIAFIHSDEFRHQIPSHPIPSRPIPPIPIPDPSRVVLYSSDVVRLLCTLPSRQILAPFLSVLSYLFCPKNNIGTQHFKKSEVHTSTTVPKQSLIFSFLLHPFILKCLSSYIPSHPIPSLPDPFRP